MSSTAPTIDLPGAAPEVAAEAARWLSYLAAERRMSPKTVEAYGRDLRQFLEFLCEHLGARVTFAALNGLTPADVRALHGVPAGARHRRPLADALARRHPLVCALPGEATASGKVGALAAVRTPKIAKTLPKPLAIASARSITDTGLRAGEAREPWILARDAAVLALLYGSGLRISEALGLTGEGCSIARQGRRHHRHRQGQQEAHGAGAAAGVEAGRRLRRRSAPTTCR